MYERQYNFGVMSRHATLADAIDAIEVAGDNIYAEGSDEPLFLGRWIHDPERLRPRRWYSFADDFEYGDYEFHLGEWDGRLAMCSAVHDNRDAITGWHYHMAPAAQQYGYRLQRFLAAQRRAEAQALVAIDDGEEPF